MFGDDTSLAVITGAKKVLTDRPRELPRARGAVGLNAFPPSTYEPKFQQKVKKSRSFPVVKSGGTILAFHVSVFIDISKRKII